MQSYLADQRFCSLEDVREWIDDYFASKPRSFYCEGKLIDKKEKTIASDGEYFDY